MDKQVTLKELTDAAETLMRLCNGRRNAELVLLYVEAKDDPLFKVKLDAHLLRQSMILGR